RDRTRRRAATPPVPPIARPLSLCALVLVARSCAQRRQYERGLEASRAQRGPRPHATAKSDRRVPLCTCVRLFPHRRSGRGRRQGFGRRHTVARNGSPARTTSTPRLAVSDWLVGEEGEAVADGLGIDEAHWLSGLAEEALPRPQHDREHDEPQ